MAEIRIMHRNCRIMQSMVVCTENSSTRLQSINGSFFTALPAVRSSRLSPSHHWRTAGNFISWELRKISIAIIIRLASWFLVAVPKKTLGAFSISRLTTSCRSSLSIDSTHINIVCRNYRHTKRNSILMIPRL